MKKKLLATIFVAIQLFFILFYLRNKSRIIELSYQKQKLEKALEKKMVVKQERIHALRALQNPTHVKAYAQEALGMIPLRINAIKKVPAT